MPDIVTVKNQFNNTPLHTAAIGGALEVVKYFTEDLKVDVNLTGQYKRTTLHHAAEKGHVDIVKYMIHAHRCDPLVKDQFNTTPFHLAVKFEKLNVLRNLILEVNVLNDARATFNSLNFIAILGDLEIIKYLTANFNFDPLHKNEEKLTRLHLASSSGDLQVVKYYVEELQTNINLPGGWINYTLYILLV